MGDLTNIDGNIMEISNKSAGWQFNAAYVYPYTNQLRLALVGRILPAHNWCFRLGKRYIILIYFDLFWMSFSCQQYFLNHIIVGDSGIQWVCLHILTMGERWGSWGVVSYVFLFRVWVLAKYKTHNRAWFTLTTDGNRECRTLILAAPIL